jgi:murein DD-endopeptidase MepM/ murein hydrolase activator NlpD
MAWYTWGHRAIDLAGKTGAPVYASDGGTVIYAGWNTWGYGKLVVVEHGDGWQSWYAHLSQVNVQCGQHFYQGALIGAIGSTERSFDLGVTKFG